MELFIAGMAVSLTLIVCAAKNKCPTRMNDVLFWGGVAMAIAILVAAGWKQYASRPSYGYLSLDCGFGKGASPHADYFYVLYQPSEQIQPPHFIETSSEPTFAGAHPSSFMTCKLHNNGADAASNVVIPFAYRILSNEKNAENHTLSDVDYSPVLITRVKAGSSVTLRFLDDIPGKDYLIAPASGCSMDIPGKPRERERCVLPRLSVAPENLVNFGAVLFHYRSLTDCSHGFTPPLVGNQGECLGHKKPDGRPSPRPR
jgi:hypothetical protein